MLSLSSSAVLAGVRVKVGKVGGARRVGARAARCAATEATVTAGTKFVRKHILELAPYTPIVPFEVLSEQLGRAPEDIVKLDANENPYGPPPEVKEALASIQFPHIYPDPESRALRKALAEDCGVPMDNLLVGCGADELIDLLMRVILDPGDVIINTPPTFGMYSFDCAVNGRTYIRMLNSSRLNRPLAETSSIERYLSVFRTCWTLFDGGVVVDVPRSEAPSFSVDVEGIQKAVKEHNPKILFLTSPNNPDGSVLSDEDLDVLLKLPVLVVLDEAYIEFSGTTKSRITDVTKHDNLIVLRTFSKRAALAGMRVGYGAFPKGIIEYVWRAKQPYNVSVAAEVAACAALSNPEYLKDVKDKLVAERERLFSVLSDCPFLTPYPSAANFILCKVDESKDALELKELLATKGIMVRHYTKPASIAGCIRVSVGKPEQTDAVRKALAAC